MLVSQDGAGDFKTLQDAVDALPNDNPIPCVIHIAPGVYRQKVVITKPNVIIVGENSQNTVLTYGDGAKTKRPDGVTEMGTFLSYSVGIEADGFMAENITFENSAGPGKIAGQALAISINADKAIFRNCRFSGHQDTIFTGPKPPKNGCCDPLYESGGLRQYFENCFICGDVDFIFGSSAAVFQDCEIYSLNHGYITAASTPKNQKFGYVFLNCKLTGSAGPDSVFLGRPWRDYAKTVFINCKMGSHIKPEGWNDWNKKGAVQTRVFYAEYGSTGPGAPRNTRVDWAKRLTEEQAKQYSVKNVLSGSDGWNPLLVKTL